MLPLRLPSMKVSVIALASVAMVFSMFLISGLMQSLSLVGEAHAGTITTSPGKVYLSPKEAAAAATVAAATPVIREVNIANSGLVLLRGARVLSVSGDTMRVDTSWGASDFIWAVSIGYNTEVFAANGEKEPLSAIAAGDIISVTGQLRQGGTEPAVDAQYVRE